MQMATPKGIRALLFDLDGTLYRQAPLRLRMMGALALLPLETRSLGQARRSWRAIRAFRSTRETLRDLADGALDLDRQQYRRPAALAGISEAEMEAIAQEWLHRRPLPYLERCQRPELPELLDALARRDLRAGVFSDYPAEAKLEAMGLAGRFSPVLAATDPEIHAFKPHPAGILRACELWGLAPSELLYVGDRPEVDAVAAAAAGAACAIIGGKQGSGADRAPYLPIERLTEILDVL